MADVGRKANCIQRYADFIDLIALGEEAARRLVSNSFAKYSY